MRQGADTSNRAVAIGGMENSEISDDASNLSTDKNKSNAKLKGKALGTKPINSGFLLDRKNPVLLNWFYKMGKEKRISK